MMKKFMKICRKTQEELKRYLADVLVSAGYKPVNEDGFLYAPGDIPVLVTAHMDTVHKETCRTIEIMDNILSSPQGIGGDDRCGIYMIVNIITKTKLRPYILFCEDEEIGGVGSAKFCKTEYIDDLRKLKFLIELDRANKDDLVFYDCDNEDFTDFVRNVTGYHESWGSFSDISTLMPECGVAGVNLSCGYYKPHTTKEYVNFDEMLNTIEVTKKLIKKAAEEETPQFEFVEARHSFYGWDSDSWGWSNWNRWDNWDYGNKGRDKKFFFQFYDEDNVTLLEDFVEASSIDEATGKFLRTYPYLTYNDIVDFYW